ncbi:hypothetical protein MKY27_15510 [Solibacillus sp. FSL R5-0449]|nr:hypothetical protein [Solibacillus isronensis]
MTLLKMVSSIVACTNSHPFDEDAIDESSDMNRWENEGGRPL